MRLSVRRGATLLLYVFGLYMFTKVLHQLFICWGSPALVRRVSVLVQGRNQTQYHYSQQSPVVFVGGVPRSGTTLMRAMLDAHPLIRCGEETRVIPRLLGLRQGWKRPGADRQSLENEGITQETLDAATTAFLLQIIARHGEPAQILCNKDPFTLKSSMYLSNIFPK